MKPRPGKNQTRIQTQEMSRKAISGGAQSYSRREFAQLIGASGAFAGLGVSLGKTEAAFADPGAQANKDDRGNLIRDPLGKYGESPATIAGEKVLQPQREIPVMHKTDVLVIGGGPAGVIAAIAASRTGARATLMERYGYLGGMWSGGMVLRIMGTHVKAEGGRTKKVVSGIGDELLQRMMKMGGALIERGPGILEPTGDPEAIKVIMDQMVEEAGVYPIYHCWGVDAIMDGSTVRGAVFESKSGRQAILAKAVVDATGDGDVFAAAGAEHERRIYHAGLPYRIGNLDKADREKAAASGRKPRNLGSVTPIPGVNWVNMQGPDASALDVRDLTRLELAHRRQIWKQVQELRATPGYEQTYLMETAPQLGVRIGRVLSGVATLTMQGVKDNRKFPDVVAVGGAWAGDHAEWQVPYGALVPKDVENLLAAGRCVSGEPLMADLIRVIPNCWITGHAAGCAAALAVQDKCRVRDVEVPKLQKLLREQDAYLG